MTSFFTKRHAEDNDRSQDPIAKRYLWDDVESAEEDQPKPLLFDGDMTTSYGEMIAALRMGPESGDMMLDLSESDDQPYPSMVELMLEEDDAQRSDAQQRPGIPIEEIAEILVQ